MVQSFAGGPLVKSELHCESSYRCPSIAVHVGEESPYTANHDAGAALTSSVCGACTDWTG